MTAHAIIAAGCGRRGAIGYAVALAGMVPGLADAISPPIPCGDANGDANYDYQRLSDDRVATTMWSLRGLRDARQVRLMSCAEIFRNHGTDAVIERYNTPPCACGLE